jgi:hypothetical protein
MSEVIYNVTINVSEEVHDRWLDWMCGEHIPEVLQTGMFTQATYLRVHAFEQGGRTYAVQYTAASMENLDRYIKEFAPALRAKTETAFGDQVHPFRTTLEVLQKFKPSR